MNSDHAAFCCQGSPDCTHDPKPCSCGGCDCREYAEAGYCGCMAAAVHSVPTSGARS